MKQTEALDLLKMGHNIFLTGPAGSGKTYVLGEYIKYLKRQNIPVAITASTGIAATLLGGVTVHSWTGLGVRDSLDAYGVEQLKEKKYLWDRFKKYQVLIIDEISMLSRRQLDAIDALGRAFRDERLPFGGLQVVMSGDFFQLPPISQSGRGSLWAYLAESWGRAAVKVCYLEEQFRQREDQDYFTVLQAIRNNEVSESVKKLITERFNQPPKLDVMPTRLYTHNVDVDVINGRELANLDGTQKEYQMAVKGNKKMAEGLKRGLLAPEILYLKLGARVMFVRNNFDAGFVNGTLGVVKKFSRRGLPEVRLSSGEVIEVEPETWVLEEDGKIKAEVSQLPLRLAWAITVHKSQGMSLDAMEVDLSKAFVAGMGYVALSRVRSLRGLNILGINELALTVDQEIAEQDQRFQALSRNLGAGLNCLTVGDKKRLIDKFSNETKVATPPPKVSTYEATKQLVLAGLMLREMASRRQVTEETIIAHLEKLQAAGEDLNLDYLKPAPNRFKRIKEAFIKTGDRKLSPVKNLLPESFTFRELRLARLFLD